jgi:hypothetical protein
MAFGIVLLILGLSSSPAFSQADEIQVYDGSIAAPGVFNLTLHNNFTPDGRKTPAFPGAVTPDKSLNGVPEWAYGAANWFEAGLYLPLYTIDKNQGPKIDGTKLRALFVAPHNESRTFLYGANFEFSANAKQWDRKLFTAEIRPIVGLHLSPVDIIVNPILDSSYDGFKNLEFVPAERVAYNFSKKWALAAEEYADYGTLKRFQPPSAQSHQLYAVVDRNGKALNVEAGAGFGLNNASDKLTLKLILSRDL